MTEKNKQYFNQEQCECLLIVCSVLFSLAGAVCWWTNSLFEYTEVVSLLSAAAIVMFLLELGQSYIHKPVIRLTS